MKFFNSRVVALVFAVEAILAERNRGRQKEYLIKWKEFADEYNSWEPKANIMDPKLLRIWNARKILQSVNL
jgi:hypothetical protein